MNKLSEIIAFIKEKRKILASLFLIIGMLSSTIFVITLSKRPHDIRSKASESVENSSYFTKEFISSKGQYKLSYDQRRWTPTNQPDEAYTSRAVFNLNKEYGLGRVDIMEGESDKDLATLTDEIIKETSLNPLSQEPTQFQDKPAYLITYTEEFLGEEVYLYQQVVKNNNKFLIIEKRAPNLIDSQAHLESLFRSISFTDTPSSPQVKGISSSLTSLTTVELIDLVRPSVANILHVFCLEVKNLQTSSLSLSKPQYNFCSLTKGSGFVVNEKGVIATNGHVAKVYPEEGLVTNLFYEGGRSFATDLIRGVYLSEGQTISPQEAEGIYRLVESNPQFLDRFLKEILNLIEQKAVSVRLSDEKFFINIGNKPVEIDYKKMNQGDYINSVIPSATTFNAKLMDFNYPNKYSYEAVVNNRYQRGSDVALLQITDSSYLFPTLELGGIENIKEGSDVVVVGYPILVEGEKDPRAAISYETSTEPTITRGIISAIKQDLTGKTIFQTDASIDHGNSGGPGFDSSGQVIGIATFLVESQSGNFNFLRSITELKELMSKNKIDNKLGEVTNLWRVGLDNFRNRYYKKALANFEKVEKLNPSHPTVKEFIQNSKEAIDKGESLEGVIGLFKNPQSTNLLLAIFGVISIISFMLTGFLYTLPLFDRSSTKV